MYTEFVVFMGLIGLLSYCAYKWGYHTGRMDQIDSQIRRIEERAFTAIDKWLAEEE